MATVQRDLFRPMCATHRTRQAGLFDACPVVAHGQHCDTCGRPMIVTASAYLCCPAGCGKLIHEPHATADDSVLDALIAAEESSGQAFPDEPPAEGAEESQFVVVRHPKGRAWDVIDGANPRDINRFPWHQQAEVYATYRNAGCSHGEAYHAAVG